MINSQKLVENEIVKDSHDSISELKQENLSPDQSIDQSIQLIQQEILNVNNALSQRNKKLHKEAVLRLEERKKERENTKLPSETDYTFLKLNDDITNVCRTILNDEKCVVRLTLPPNHIRKKTGSHFAFNTTELAKKNNKDVKTIFSDLQKGILSCPFVKNVFIEDSYINIEMDMLEYTKSTLKELQQMKEKFGSVDIGNKKITIVDFSSPNVAKNMTVAHLRSTIIGEVVSNICEFMGDTVLKINHLGDWGTQFGKIIYQYKQEFKERGDDFLQEIKNDPMQVLMTIYRKFNDNEDKNPQSLEDARQIFLEMENGNQEYIALWEKFLEWSVEEFNKMYNRLGVHFDVVQGESFYEDKMSEAVKEALDKGVLIKNKDGTVIFPGQEIFDPATGKKNQFTMQAKNTKSEEPSFRDEIVLKPNGGTLYLTRDIAALRYRTQELGADNILYIIGKEQKSHCEMLMNISAQCGWNNLGNSQHLSFGHLNIGGRKMKSRKGKIVLLKDILDDAEFNALQCIQDKLGQLEENAPEQSQEIARKIGVGSVIYNDLRQNRERDIEFNTDVSGNLEKGTSSYLQYTYCRLGNILEKFRSCSYENIAVSESFENIVIPESLSETEKEIMIYISLFPQAMKNAYAGYAPHKITGFIEDLASIVNNFYQNHNILGEKNKEIQLFRVNLIKAIRQIFENTMKILKIELPEKM